MKKRRKKAVKRTQLPHSDPSIYIQQNKNRNSLEGQLWSAGSVETDLRSFSELTAFSCYGAAFFSGCWVGFSIAFLSGI